MEKNINLMQQEFIEKLQLRLNALQKKFNEQGYVAAGYGGNTYYCFVGAGRGFNGAAIAMMSSCPKIFDTYQDAACEVYNIIYINGCYEFIELEVIKADEYFRKLHTIIEQHLQTFKELLGYSGRACAPERTC